MPRRGGSLFVLLLLLASHPSTLLAAAQSLLPGFCPSPSDAVALLPAAAAVGCNAVVSYAVLGLTGAGVCAAVGIDNLQDVSTSCSLPAAESLEWCGGVARIDERLTSRLHCSWTTSGVGSWAGSTATPARTGRWNRRALCWSAGRPVGSEPAGGRSLPASLVTWLKIASW
jgi:hypothetical protein